MSRLNGFRLYLVMSGSNAILRTTMYLVITIYYVLVVRMNPLQLVLVGTVLEITYFLAQTPTGILADLVSRRLSIILGWVICGAMFTLEGLVPNVAVILAAQAVLGVGEAFIDGAESAWVADEVGQEALPHALLRGSQVAQVTSIAGIGVAVALASVHLALPVVVGGLGMVAMAAFFAVAMPEAGFMPAHGSEESGRPSFVGTLTGGFRLVRGSPVLLSILGVEIFTGGGSEGFDRLWEAHLIRDVHLPAIGSLKPVVWFAILAIAQSAVGFAVNRWIAPRLASLTASPAAMAQLLSRLNVLYILATVGFALSGNFALAALCLFARSAVGIPSFLIQQTWFNRSVTDSSVRATVLSMGGQCNALGQWVAGPLIGGLGSAVSLPTAVTATGLVRSPISVLFALAGRGGGVETKSLPEVKALP